MKSFPLFELFFLIKHGIAIYFRTPGEISPWYIIVYSLFLIPLLFIPFKLEIKLLFAITLLTDGLAHLLGSMWFRWAGFIAISLWWVSYLWRIFKKSESLQSPWMSK